MSTLSLTGAGPTSGFSYTPDATVLALGPSGWWDASSLNLADGTAVSSLDDQSGNARTVSQGTAANRPLFKTAILNNKPVLRFDGTDYLQVSGFTLNQPNTIFVVSSTTTDAAQPYVFDSANTSARHAMFAQSAVAFNTFAGSVAGVTENIPSSHAVWSLIFNGASSEVWKNSVSKGVSNPGAHNLTGFTMGARFNGAQAHLGDIAEALIFNSALSGTDRGTVETYLRTKYGL